MSKLETKGEFALPRELIPFEPSADCEGLFSVLKGGLRNLIPLKKFFSLLLTIQIKYKSRMEVDYEINIKKGFNYCVSNDFSF